MPHLNEIKHLQRLVSNSGGQGGTPVSRDQAPVWLYQGALPGAEEEYLAAQNAVCAVQLVDGSAQADGGQGMSAPESGKEAANPDEMGTCSGPSTAQLKPNRSKFHPMKNQSAVACFELSFSDLP